MAEPPPETPPKRRGRPRAEDPGVSVGTWLRNRDYDRLLRLAQHQDKSLAALIRDVLRMKLR